MKVLFIAGRNQESLMIEREITLLQQRALLAAGDDVTFHFLPDIPIETLPLELSRHEPEVLHISAHGTAGGLEFANSSGQLVVIEPAMLRNILHPERPPRLVYLNGCNSFSFARDLTRRVDMAIGSTAEITNRAAMTAAVLFYDRLISGFTVQDSFDAAQAIIKAIHANSASAEVFTRPGISAALEILHHVPRIIADLKSWPKDASDDEYGFELGLLGCRHDTVQVVFFTDDETYIEDENDLESDLCEIVRGSPTRGMIWGDFTWASYGDFVIHACASTSRGQSYSVSSSLCDAIKAKHTLIDQKSASQLPTPMRKALLQLKSQDGSRMISNDQKAGIRKRSKKRKLLSKSRR